MSLYYIGTEQSEYYLCHFGILGQKKGVRRYQYPDGSLTPLGRIRYRTKANLEKHKPEIEERAKKKEAKAAKKEENEKIRKASSEKKQQEKQDALDLRQRGRKKYKEYINKLNDLSDEANTLMWIYENSDADPDINKLESIMKRRQELAKNKSEDKLLKNAIDAGFVNDRHFKEDHVKDHYNDVFLPLMKSRQEKRKKK